MALELLREGRAGNNSLCGIWFSRDGTILLMSACLTLERILGKEIPGKKQLLRQESSREPSRLEGGVTLRQAHVGQDDSGWRN